MVSNFVECTQKRCIPVLYIQVKVHIGGFHSSETVRNMYMCAIQCVLYCVVKQSQMQSEEKCRFYNESLLSQK